MPPLLLRRFLRKNSVGAMIYEPAASRRYEKLPVSKRANDGGWFSFFSPYFYSMPLRDISTLLHVIRHIDVSLYFEEMNTSETINTDYGGNQDTQ